jgi:poly-gamma-glutamate system protein
MIECGIDSSSTIGIAASSSFPALIISTLASAKVLKAKVILFSSLGASMYGANDSAFTWIDIENRLSREGGLKYESTFVTYGGDYDNGNLISEEGIRIMDKAARRNNIVIYKPASLDESIKKKMSILEQNNIKLFVNIGGNEAALGNCPHSSIIPNGLQKKLSACSHSGRGLIFRMAEKGVPVINLLNIKSLAGKYGIQEPVVSNKHNSEDIFKEKRINTPIVLAGLATMLGMLFFIKKMKI